MFKDEEEIKNKLTKMSAKLPQENHKQWKAFCFFLNYQSIEKTARYSEVSERTIIRWKIKFNWDDRINEFLKKYEEKFTERYADKINAVATVTDIYRENCKSYRLLLKATKTIKNRIAEGDTISLTLNEIKLMQLEQQMGDGLMKWASMVLQQVEGTKKENPDDLSCLTDNELRLLDEIQKKVS